MKIVVSIAHKGERLEQLTKTASSLKNQCDQILIHDNRQGIDYTDNAKFLFLMWFKEPIYYFTCDDDIIYPPDYIKRTIELIEHYRCIITYHGRILKEPIKAYYSGHTVFDFRGAQEKDMFVDVAGTAVCGFRTDYFNPTEIYKSDYKRMSDLVFSLEAKRQGKRIICASRKQNWLIQQEVDSGIMQSFAGKNETQQIELAKLILE